MRLGLSHSLMPSEERGLFMVIQGSKNKYSGAGVAGKSGEKCGSCMGFCDLGSEVTQNHFHSVVFYWSKQAQAHPDSWGGDINSTSQCEESVALS